MAKKIPLFWWSSVKFEKKKFDNFGDLAGPYLVKKISGNEIRFVQPKKRKWFDLFTKVYVTAGSILPHVDKNSIVWGSGLIDRTTKISKATFLAVRGPKTREILMEYGFDVPEIYGDPALLLPNYYSPEVSKKYKIGIIPHYVDYALAVKWYGNYPEIKIIDLLNNSVEAVIDEIYSCETVISSSLHGIIAAHAYLIPVVWVKFSDNLFGDGIKFEDYFESVKVLNASPVLVEHKLSEEQLLQLVKENGIVIKPEIIVALQKRLMKVCPFQKNKDMP